MLFKLVMSKIVGIDLCNIKTPACSDIVEIEALQQPQQRQMCGMGTEQDP